MDTFAGQLQANIVQGNDSPIQDLRWGLCVKFLFEKHLWQGIKGHEDSDYKKYAGDLMTRKPSKHETHHGGFVFKSAVSQKNTYSS